MAFKPRLLPMSSYPPTRGPILKRSHCPLAREFKGSFTRQSETSQRWYTWFKSSSRTGPTTITSDLVSIARTNKKKNRRLLDRNFAILRFFSRLLVYRRLFQPRVAHMSRVAFPRVAGNPRATSFLSPSVDDNPRRSQPSDARVSPVGYTPTITENGDDDGTRACIGTCTERSGARYRTDCESSLRAAELWPAHSYLSTRRATPATKRWERRRARARVRPGEAESTSARASSTRG